MKEEKILNEITTFCNECESKECCPENECFLYRIEQATLNKKKIYQVEITETSQRVEEVEAESEEEAIDIVDELYRNGEIVIEYNDYKGYEIDIFKSDVNEK